MAAHLVRAPAFYETMPRRYQQLFRGPTVVEHAAIAARRRSAPAHGEIWRRLPQGAAIVCLVAEDRPGLLSYLATALTTQSIDLLAAHVYSRFDPDGGEWVDFLWLRRDETLAPALIEADVARVVDLLGGLLTGELRMNGRPAPRRRRQWTDASIMVRLDPGDGPRRPASLAVETHEQPSLLRAVRQRLERAGARVLDARRVPGPGARVTHRFSVVEADGRAPDQYRRGVLQAEVLRMLEPGEPHAEADFVDEPSFADDEVESASA